MAAMTAHRGSVSLAWRQLRSEPARLVVALVALDDHVNHCVTDALASGDTELAAEKSRELLDAVQRFARTR